MRFRLFILLLAPYSTILAQCDRWQQRVRYEMDVHLDVTTHRYSGVQRLAYVNNSPDTLPELFFHLYFNAFQPVSEMDVRSRTISDPDPRVADRIVQLSPEEQGRLAVERMTMDGQPCQLVHRRTVLWVGLPKPLLPGATATLELAFDGQVPVQIRRSGRNNREGIAYSMTQWYPKVAAYDQRGWHPDPYVGREFYGPFGDWEVRLTLDSSHTVAATGELVNADAVGHGYAIRTSDAAARGGELTWHFRAANVHDFAWASDPDYVHVITQVPDGPLLRFFYQDKPEEKAAWKNLPGQMVKAFQYMNQRFGKYPYPVYSFVQGGDGGMEYPMLTLIVGRRNPVGVSVHESVHSWFHGVLASNEKRYPWMDEGFTEYASHLVMRELNGGEGDPHAPAYKGYFELVRSDAHEPMSLHADHYRTNYGYSTTAYNKGEVFLHQLGYVIGDSTLQRGLRRYFATCQFKHPEPQDVERVMEKESGLVLDWYFDEWINTTRTVDYAVDTLVASEGGSSIGLRRKGDMLMPMDVLVTTKDGKRTYYHIPLSLMQGAKPKGSEAFTFEALAPWPWTDPLYWIQLPVPPRQIVSVEIDPSERLADVNRLNNIKSPRR